MSDAIQKKTNFNYVQVGGVKLHYAHAGDGKKLVILLHGFPEFWYSWRNQLVDLSDEYTVVAPDMHGYNLSDKPQNTSDYEIDKLVDDVTGLICKFGRKKAFVVGHDWGAGVAWEVATKHPEFVEKLVTLQVPPISVWKENQTIQQFLASWYMFFFQIPKIPEWLMSQNDFAKLAIRLKTTTAEKDVFNEADIAEYKKSWSKNGALTGGLNYYRANIIKQLFSIKSRIKIKVPTLFIYGEKDHVVLPNTFKNIGDIIDAQYEEVRMPEAGHWVQNQAPQAVTDSIREFLNK